MRGWTRESVGTLDLPVESYCAAQLDIDKSIINILSFFSAFGIICIAIKQIKGLVHFQNKTFLIIYLPPFHPKCLCLSFFGRNEIKIFEEIFSGFFSIKWTSMGANRWKVQIAVSMQLQRALCDPNRGIRVLSSETICHFLQKSNIHIPFNRKCSSFTNSTSRIM